ncbi:MAG: putative glycoside hydrolase [Actinomycetia bacterium]|nr:putative glycoside hydrolase [Actinomycetes bacterium]
MAFTGAAAFACGFILLWSLGSWLAGGEGFPWGSEEAAVGNPAVPPVATEYEVEPLVDLPAFRDLSYVPVKGIYLTSYTAGSSDRLTGLLDLAGTTEINAFVIDVKDDLGTVTYDAAVPLAQELGLVEDRIPNIDALMAQLTGQDIIPIARLVCFKDSALAQARPDLAVRSKKGGMWEDWKGLNYVDPYSHEVWEYIVQVAEDAARRGFREIQFDYVRFPSDGPISEAVYPGEYCSMEDAIAGFLAYARGRLEKLGVWVSADVFGLTVHVDNDGGIGQRIEKISRNVDIVCPMVYPSHYDSGSYGLDNPDANPYELVTAAMKDTKKRLAGTGAMGRPWLKDDDYGVDYGVEEVKAEIKAAEEQGFSEWLLWNAGNKYTKGALRSQEG